MLSTCCIIKLNSRSPSFPQYSLTYGKTHHSFSRCFSIVVIRVQKRSSVEKPVLDMCAGPWVRSPAPEQNKPQQSMTPTHGAHTNLHACLLELVCLFHVKEPGSLESRNHTVLKTHQKKHWCFSFPYSLRSFINCYFVLRCYRVEIATCLHLIAPPKLNIQKIHIILQCVNVSVCVCVFLLQHCDWLDLV